MWVCTQCIGHPSDRHIGCTYTAQRAKGANKVRIAYYYVEALSLGTRTFTQIKAVIWLSWKGEKEKKF